MGYYSNGDEYCDRRRCRNLNRSRQPVRPVDDIDGLDACERHCGGDDGDAATDQPDDWERNVEDIQQLIANGICPWCDDYTGENVGHHASIAHPDDWSDYSAKV